MTTTKTTNAIIKRVAGALKMKRADTVIINIHNAKANAHDTATPIASKPLIDDKQAANLRTIIKGIDLLDTECGREPSQALLFHIINTATGASTYKDTPADQYHTAVQALCNHIRTRKLKTPPK